MKNKVLKILILLLMIINIMQIAVFANELTLTINTGETEIKKGEKVKIIVSWEQGMQAADFFLDYDEEKLKFIKTDISDDFINCENGRVKVAWFSMDNTDKTQIVYTFEATKTGTAVFKTKVNGGFATGELKIPKKYNEGKLNIEIHKQSIIITVIKVISILILIVVISLIIKKSIKTKTGGKKRNVRTNKK